MVVPKVNWSLLCLYLALSAIAIALVFFPLLMLIALIDPSLVDFASRSLAIHYYGRITLYLFLLFIIIALILPQKTNFNK